MSQPSISHDKTKDDKKSKWSVWYEPGSEDDSHIYRVALERCKQVNQDINSKPISSKKSIVRIVLNIPERRLIHAQQLEQPYTAEWVSGLITKERENIKKSDASKPPWATTVADVASKLISIATALKPVIDIFVSSSLEISVPYACLWVVFQGFVVRKQLKDSVMGLILSLSEDLQVFEALKDMSPTTDIKIILSEIFFHTVDLLGRLAAFYSHHFFRQLGDALFASDEYNFTVYHDNVKAATRRLNRWSKVGHYAEQKDIKVSVDEINSELHRLTLQLKTQRLAQTQQYASDLIDMWDSDVGDVEHELQLWDSVRFHTDMRHHWSQNGILDYLSVWRKSCDSSRSSIFWISTDSNGEQLWLTEFSIDLVRIFRSQGQRIVFGFCDRPEGVQWSPKQLFKHLIAQLINDDPNLVMALPSVFNRRQFRKSSTSAQTLQLFQSIVSSLESLVIVIDRLDLCALDPGEPQERTMVEELSILVREYPRTLKVIISTGRMVTPDCLPKLPISFAMVSTRRPPRRKYEDWKQKYGSVASMIGGPHDILMIPPHRRSTTATPDIAAQRGPRWLIPHS